MAYYRQGQGRENPRALQRAVAHAMGRRASCPDPPAPIRLRQADRPKSMSVSQPETFPATASELTISLADRQLLDGLVRLARLAGDAIEAVRARGCTPQDKIDGSPVTEADLAADLVIARGLGELLPGVPVISEETVERTPDLADPDGLFILVDPLDGTREFISGSPDYTVNIALMARRRPVAGVVLAPATGVAWTGLCPLEGPGEAHRIDHAGIAPVPVRVRQPGLALEVLASRSHPDERTDAYLAGLAGHRRIAVGSSLKFCRIAEGGADLYPRWGTTMEWDTAAGHAVAAAAGALVTAPDGTPLTYGKQDAGWRNGPFLVRGSADIPLPD